jgi:hypothetical protein
MLLRARIVAVIFVAASALLSLEILLPRLLHLTLRPDLTFMWAGARASDPYDIWAVTRAQAWIRAADKPLAFVYPPSSLPLFFPFGLLPFWSAFIAWTAFSITLFWTAAKRLTKYPALAFLSPHVVLTLCLGQTALITGAATIWGITLLRSRPILAGVCLGLGAALKPQCFLLAPIALISGRHWKTIGGAALAWCLLAIPVLPLWLDWWRVAQMLPAILDRYYPIVGAFGATPTDLAKALEVSTTSFQIAGFLFGTAVVWLSFQTTDNVSRVVGLVSGTLLASPYAVRYELAALAPAYVAAYLCGTTRLIVIAIPLLCTNVLTIVPALFASSLANVLDQKQKHERREHCTEDG